MPGWSADSYIYLLVPRILLFQSLFIGRHVADSRKSPIANPTGRETTLLFLFLRFARTRDWVCALGMRWNIAATRAAGLNLDALPLSTREFLRAGIRATAKKLSIYCARGVDTR